MPRESYSPVSGEEGKPLREPEEGSEEYDGGVSRQELHALNRQLKRNNFYLKIIVGLIGAAVATYFISLIVKAAWKEKPLLPTPVPPLREKIVVFDKNPEYMTRPEDEPGRIWDHLLPDGRGFVFIDDYKKYDLKPGQETPAGMIWSVSMFHQLHCLGQIRKYAWTLLTSIEKNDTELQQGMLNMLVTKDGGDHLHHCFDYLRQGIICSGDMAMEWPRTEPDGERFAVDGWGIPHVCKDWSQIDDYMKKMHFNMSTNDEIAPHR